MKNKQAKYFTGENFLNYGMFDTGLLHSQTHIPRGPSGSMSRVAVGSGGGTVGVGVGAIHKEIVAYYISLYAHVQWYAYLLCTSLLPEVFWEGRW